MQSNYTRVGRTVRGIIPLFLIVWNRLLLIIQMHLKGMF